MLPPKPSGETQHTNTLQKPHMETEIDQDRCSLDDLPVGETRMLASERLFCV